MRWWMVLIVGGMAACGPTAAPPTVAPQPTSQPEDVDEEPFYAPDFTLESLSGEQITLSEQRGGWVLLNFWQTTCMPCVEEMPVFQQLYDTRSELTVLAVNIREDEAAIRSFLQDHGLSFPVLYSQDAVSQAYTVMALPQTVLIDPNGEIVWRQFGPVELASFESLIDDYIAAFATT